MEQSLRDWGRGVKCEALGMGKREQSLRDWDEGLGTLGTLQCIQSREDRGELGLQGGHLGLLSLKLSINLL